MSDPAATLAAPSSSVRSAIRQLDRLDDNQLARITDAEAGACTGFEDAFTKMKGKGVSSAGEMSVRTLAVLCLARLIEATPPEELLTLITPFNPLSRPWPRA